MRLLIVSIVTDGLTADKQEVSVLMQWAGWMSLSIADRPDPGTVRRARAVRKVLDTPDYQSRAKDMAHVFASPNAEARLLALVS